MEIELNKIKVLAFDCDGTLMNTVPDYLYAMNLAMEHYSLPLIKEKDRYISTKRDSGSHGIGLHTVKKLVERYGGIMRIVTGEREFSVEIIFTIR